MTEPSDLVENPALPRLMPLEDGFAPQAPTTLAETGIDPAVLADLALKAAYTVPNFITEWAARRLHLPLQLAQQLFEQLRQDRLVEVLGQSGPFSYKFAVTQRGRERAGRLVEISGYVGPAPVSLEAYTAMLEWQLAHLSPVTPEEGFESAPQPTETRATAFGKALWIASAANPAQSPPTLLCERVTQWQA